MDLSKSDREGRLSLPPSDEIYQEMGWQRWKDDGNGNLIKIKNFKLYTHYNGQHIKSVYNKLRKKGFVAWLEKRDPEEVIWITGYRSESVISKFLKEKLNQHVETFLPKMWVHDKWYRTPGWAHRFSLNVLYGHGNEITVKVCLEALNEDCAARVNKSMRIVVLISGRGSNMKNLVESYYDDESPAEVIKIISNNPDAEGLMAANQYHIPTVVIDHTKFETWRNDFEEALHEEIIKDEPDYICLAGFMRILSPLFIKKWPKRIINIHPSLLPAYPGLDTHRKVLEANEIATGCTVHFVDEGVDTGKIIVQKQVPILPEDTEETLADRVLTAEHLLYPQALRIVKQDFTFRNITIKPNTRDLYK